MYQYTPRYPKAFGHPAWSLYGFVNDALLQDLFWRKVQTDPALVARLATILDPNATQENKNIFLSDNTAISLYPESCGAYSTIRNSLLNYLHGNSEDKKIISPEEELENNFEIIGADLNHPARDYVIEQVKKGTPGFEIVS